MSTLMSSQVRWRPAACYCSGPLDGGVARQDFMRALKADTPTFLTLPPTARAYVGAVVIAGTGCLIAAATQLRLEHAAMFAVLLSLAVAISAKKIELPLGRSQSNLSLSHAVNFWALFALGPADTVCIAAVSAWAQCTLHRGDRNPLHRIMFSIGSLTLTMSVAALPLVFGLGLDPTSAPALVRAAAVVAPLYFFVNSGLVAGAIALSTRQPVARVWHRNFLWSAPSYLAGAALAAVATAASARGWFGWLALLAVPLYLVFRSYHTVVARLREEQDQTKRAMDVQLATIEALALAIEAKAGSTPEHIQSIQQYAATLGEAAGLSDNEVQALRTAALLHDVGNMAVPEHILSKPEALTPEEFERVKIHPRVGAEILRNVPFGAPVAELVLCHHERWDGLGYPAGLRGDAIPLGARILAIADCYSTLQTDRPYRPARTEAEAVQVLRDFSGTSFDPTLVELLIARLDRPAAALVAGAPYESAWTPAAEGMDALRGHRGHASRRAGALRNRAGARLAPRHRRSDDADPGQGQAAGAVRDLRALPRRRAGRLRLPLRARARNRSAVQVGAEVVERHLAAAAGLRRRARRARRGADRPAALSVDRRGPPDRRARPLSRRSRARSPTTTGACSAGSASRPPP